MSDTADHDRPGLGLRGAVAQHCLERPVTKRDLYARHGIGHYWIVDVDARTGEAFGLEIGRWVLLGNYDEQICARIPPFEEVELAVGRLFLPRP